MIIIRQMQMIITIVHFINNFKKILLNILKFYMLFPK